MGLNLIEGKYVVLQVSEYSSMDLREYSCIFKNRDDPRIKETIQNILNGNNVRAGWTEVHFDLFEVEAKRIPLKYSKESEVKIG